MARGCFRGSCVQIFEGDFLGRQHKNEHCAHMQGKRISQSSSGDTFD